MAPPLRCVTYSRVSTADQQSESQVVDLSDYCAARGWLLVESVVDHGFSGGTQTRPGLKQLMGLVRARKVDVVLVMKIDRLARSIRHLLALLDELSALGVHFVSVKDQIDMTTATGRLALHVLAAFSEFERALIRERTVLGLAHARRKGKRLGRPRIHDPEAILRLRAKGMSYRRISAQLGVPMATIAKAVKGAHLTPSREAKDSSINTEAAHE